MWRPRVHRALITRMGWTRSGFHSRSHGPMETADNVLPRPPDPGRRSATASRRAKRGERREREEREELRRTQTTFDRSLRPGRSNPRYEFFRRKDGESADGFRCASNEKVEGKRKRVGSDARRQTDIARRKTKLCLRKNVRFPSLQSQLIRSF